MNYEAAGQIIPKPDFLRGASEGKLKLMRIPGNQVCTERMSADWHAIRKFGGVKPVLEWLRRHLAQELDLDFNQTASLHMENRSTGDVEFWCLARLDKLPKSATDEVEAVREYTSLMFKPTELTPVPDFIDI